VVDIVSVPPRSDADSQLPPVGVLTDGVAVTDRLFGLVVTESVWLAGAPPPIEYENETGEGPLAVIEQGLIVSQGPCCTVRIANRGMGLLNSCVALPVENEPPPGSGAKLRAALLGFTVAAALLYATYTLNVKVSSALGLVSTTSQIAAAVPELSGVNR
jgi:hypothetical protein